MEQVQERVNVPCASEMDDETFRSHIRLRHAALRFRPTRNAHRMSHHASPQGLFDHVHRKQEFPPGKAGLDAELPEAYNRKRRGEGCDRRRLRFASLRYN